MTGDSKHWADPSPAGLMSIGMGLLGFYALLSGQVDPSGSIILSMWLFGGFLITLIVGLVKVLDGQPVDANMNIFFSAYLMLASSLELIVKWTAAIKGWQIDTLMSGFLWIPLFITLWVWSPCIWKAAPGSFCLCVLAADVGFPIICFVNLGILSPGLLIIAAYCLLIASILCIYTGAAALLNPTFRRAVLPVGSPLIKSNNPDNISA